LRSKTTLAPCWRSSSRSKSSIPPPVCKRVAPSGSSFWNSFKWRSLARQGYNLGSLNDRWLCHAIATSSIPLWMGTNGVWSEVLWRLMRSDEYPQRSFYGSIDRQKLQWCTNKSLLSTASHE
jgi:hypothetical protein